MLEQVISTILVFVVLVGSFISIYKLNQRVPKPEGVESMECSGCNNFRCEHNTSKARD